MTKQEQIIDDLQVLCIKEIEAENAKLRALVQMLESKLQIMETKIEMMKRQAA